MNEVRFSINKHYETDVLVIGGGTAGFAAAICAARNGASVLLCEKEGCLGGNLIDIYQKNTVYYTPIKGGSAYAVPYRVLLPQRINNLLVAGRRPPVPLLHCAPGMTLPPPRLTRISCGLFCARRALCWTKATFPKPASEYCCKGA